MVVGSQHPAWGGYTLWPALVILSVFFNTLRTLGYDVIAHPFPDHHPFIPANINFDDDLPVLMTAKDAVKCAAFATDRHWYLPVIAQVPGACIEQLVAMVGARAPATSGWAVSGKLL